MLPGSLIGEVCRARPTWRRPGSGPGDAAEIILADVGTPGFSPRRARAGCQAQLHPAPGCDENESIASE